MHWNPLRSFGAWPDFATILNCVTRSSTTVATFVLWLKNHERKKSLNHCHKQCGIRPIYEWRFFVPKSTWNIIRVVSLKYFLRNIKIQIKFDHFHIVWKSLKMSHLNFGIFHQFLSIITDLSGNTVWPQASGFQKVAKIDQFWHF